MAWEHRYIKQWIVWNIYFKGSSDVWLDSGQKASLKMSCFVSPHKLLTSEQWYEHKSQNVTCAFNLQDSHVWSHRLRLQLQSKPVKKDSFYQRQHYDGAHLLWYCQQKKVFVLIRYCLFFTFGFCVVILVQWSNATLCCLDIKYSKRWFVISSLIMD